MNNESRGGVRWATVAMTIICIVVAGAFIGAAWYFWGEDGAKVALIVTAIVLLWLLYHAQHMGTVRTVSSIYHDASQNLIDFQAADDRGEIARTAVKLITSGNQLDSRVLGLAGNLAKGQARAMIAQQPAPQNDIVENDYWGLPVFEDEEESR